MLGNLQDHNEHRRVSTCKGLINRCHSLYCPFCSNGKTSRLLGRVRGACHTLPERRRENLKYVTFTCSDVPIQDLRDTAHALMQAGRQTFKRLDVPGHISRLEISSKGWHNFHPHVHAVVDFATGGRGYVSKAAFTHAWTSALPADLRAPESGVHIESVDNLAEATSYLCESNFHKFIREKNRVAIEEVSRTVEAITALHGLRKFTSRGTLALSN